MVTLVGERSILHKISDRWLFSLFLLFTVMTTKADKAVELVRDLLSRAANTQLPESPETLKGGTKAGVKRFLTSSPQGSSSSTVLKRTRPTCDDSFTGTMDQSIIEETAESFIPTHYLTSPMNPSDITQIAHELKSLMMPEIGTVLKSLIKESQPDFVTLIDSAMKKMSVDFQNVTRALQKENESLKQENISLKKEVTHLKMQVGKVELAADSNEQYSRRNNLRISGIPITEGENTDEKVLKLSNEVGANLELSDIDRSHRVGPMKDGKRAIIVKFTSYRARQQLYGVRRNLRKSERYKNTYINEDITAYRSKILFSARNLVRSGKLKAAYSGDGKIFLRDNNDMKYHITSESDLEQFKDTHLK